MISKSASTIALLLLAACQANAASSVPEQFVDLKNVVADATFDIRYYSTNNFVGAKVAGYHAAKCIIHKSAARDLKNVSAELALLGYRLKVFDCYRPEQAVAHFMRWAEDLTDVSTKPVYYPNIAKAALVPDYIASRSGHSRGYTIDLSLEQKQPDGSYREVDMGSPFDMFDALSNTEHPHITERQKRHRALLNNTMSSYNFSNYSMEWWHFTHTSDPNTTYWDFPVK